MPPEIADIVRNVDLGRRIPPVVVHPGGDRPPSRFYSIEGDEKFDAFWDIAMNGEVAWDRFMVDRRPPSVEHETDGTAGLDVAMAILRAARIAGVRPPPGDYDLALEAARAGRDPHVRS